MRGEWVRRPAGSATVVFVHGILSSGETCWRHANGAYWPELLKNEAELAEVGIYVYTYQTGFASGSYSLSNVVDDLKERFFTLDRVADSRKVVFVCHSMGGIVVRKFIVERLNDLLDCNVEIGLFLVASPSLGSDYANWLEPIAKFAGHAQAQALRFNQENQWLNDLDKTFINLKGSERLALYGKELLEDKFIPLTASKFDPLIKFFRHKPIVEWFSGNRNFPEPYKVPGSDHFPEHKTDISKYAGELMGWLILLCVKNAPQIDFNNTTEVVVPVKTQAGMEVFVARLQERPAKFNHKDSDNVLGEGFIDPADLELGLLKDDRLSEIKKLVYREVFKKEPTSGEDWQARLKHTLELDSEDRKKMYYLTLSQIRHSECVDLVKQLKTDLPHLRILVTGRDAERGDSILIMDESRLEALVLSFLNTLAESQ